MAAMIRTYEIAAAKLAAWQAAEAELFLLENRLGEAIKEYAKTLGEPPRELIVEAERKRAEVQKLLELAIEALDAHCTVRTGPHELQRPR